MAKSKTSSTSKKPKSTKADDDVELSDDAESTDQEEQQPRDPPIVVNLLDQTALKHAMDDWCAKARSSYLALRNARYMMALFSGFY